MNTSKWWMLMVSMVAGSMLVAAENGVEPESKAEEQKGSGDAEAVKVDGKIAAKYRLNLENYKRLKYVLNLKGYQEAKRNWKETASDLRIRKARTRALDRVDKAELQKIGKPPAITSWNLLDGGKVDLNAYKGNKIVVLGFWGLPCIDCILPLPYWAELRDKYQDKDVVVISVDFRDKRPADIKEFMDKQNFKLPVALGTNAFGGPYGLGHRMPLTYIIGKDGLIKSIDLIIDDTLVPVIGGKLDLLLAGKELPDDGKDVEQATHMAKPMAKPVAAPSVATKGNE